MPARLPALHNTLRTLLNQEARQEAPAVLDEALYQAALGHFGALIGSLTGYAPGRPIPPVSVQVTARVSEELRPFQGEAALTATNGLVLKPATLAYPLRLTATYGSATAGVEVVTDGRWDYRTGSDCLLAAPSATKPVARVTPAGWQVVPSPDAVTVAFYRHPARPVLVYQVDGSGLPVTDTVTDEPLINETATVDAEWLPLSDTDIIRRACEFLGLRTGDRPAQEFARVTAQQPS